MNNLEMLLRAARANPADDTVRLAFADEIQEVDEARAEFIRVQIQKPNHHNGYNFRAATLFHANWRRWVPEPFMAGEVTFSRGFISSVRCDCPKFYDHAGVLFREGVMEKVELRDRRAESDHVPASEFGPAERWYIWKQVWLPQRWSTWVGEAEALPSELYHCLPKVQMRAGNWTRAEYEHRRDAHADLAIAALAYGKMRLAELEGVVL